MAGFIVTKVSLNNISEHREEVRAEVEKDVRRFTAAGVPPTCHKGCSHCCHVPINCLPEEVDEILSIAPPVNMERLKAQVEDWGKANKTCVFLVDGACGVHEKKPMTCINHLVDSPAEQCIVSGGSYPHYIYTKAASDIIKKLFQENTTVTLHEAVYQKLTEE